MPDSTASIHPTPLTFRHARHADIPLLVELVTSSYRGDASRVGWTTEADLLDGARIDGERLTADIERPQSVILLGEENGEILACAHVAVDDGTGYFGMFSVWPDRQGKGIGKQMLAEAERIVREEFGQRTLRMTVIDVRDALIDYYARRGYQRTGIHKPFPYGDERFGTPKRDDLRFEVLEKTL